MTYKSSDDYNNEGLDFYNGGEFEKALQSFREGLARFPHDSDLLLGCAMTHIRLGDYIQACEILEGLHAKSPESSDVLQGLAETYLWLGRKEKALEFIELALRNPENDASFVNTLAMILYEHDQFEDAARYYKKAFDMTPDFAPAHMGYAACCHRLGKPQEAIASLKRAIGADARYWEAHSYLGNLLYDLGDKKEAKAIFDKIPLEGIWDPTTLKRLLLLSRKEEEKERRRKLQERLEEVKRARPRLSVEDFLNQIETLLDRDAAKKSPDAKRRFWTGSPTLVPIMGLRMEALLTRMFSEPCDFSDGNASPRFAQFDKGLCEQYLLELAKFLEEEKRLLKPGKSNKTAIEMSGLTNLLFYGAAIIQEMRRRYPAGIINKGLVRRLHKALSLIQSRLPAKTQAREALASITTALG
ncbi:MAG: tetratricopeptide repeat protein [Elusimicrobia bacterium]|nr:tetratricopeptide repeat protein [Elusimicrobiota bacterium]